MFGNITVKDKTNTMTVKAYQVIQSIVKVTNWLSLKKFNFNLALSFNHLILTEVELCKLFLKSIRSCWNRMIPNRNITYRSIIKLATMSAMDR